MNYCPLNIDWDNINKFEYKMSKDYYFYFIILIQLFRYNLDISLEEAFEGVDKKINFRIASTCTSCSGSGSEGNSKPIQCSTCGGSGKVRAQQGFFVVERTCGSCSGTGQVIKDPCKKCNGQGLNKRFCKIRYEIWKGFSQEKDQMFQ